MKTKTTKPKFKKGVNTPKNENPIKPAGIVPKGEGLRRGNKCDNDPSWYAKDPQLLKDVASLSFAQMSGLKLDLDYKDYFEAGSETNIAVCNSYEKVPGIMRIVLEPCVGAGKNDVDATSVAARNLYTFVRHANSGSANYESPDLFMMILAHASAQAWLEELKRVYGLLSVYSTRNRFLGKALITSMGYDYDNLIANMPALRAHINITANKLNAIKIPAGLPVLDRWKWIPQHVYGDSDTAKAQYYFYQFDKYLVFNGYKSATGTSLLVQGFYSHDHSGYGTTPDRQFKTVSWSSNNSNLKKLTSIVNFTNTLVNPLFYEEDIGIMSGDIMKAFGDAVSVVTGIDETYQVTPEYSEEVLNQIHNIKFAGVWNCKAPDVHTITQSDGNRIIETIRFTTGSLDKFRVFAKTPYVYDSYWESNRPEDVMVGTRLCPATALNETNGIIDITSCGSEIATSATVFSLRPEGEELVAYKYFHTNSATMAGPLSAFDWHPRALFYASAGASQLPDGLLYWLGDLENYTLISNEVLTNMHRVAILSELAYSAKTDLK